MTAATDFTLMAGAFATDHKMATQVCRLLANGNVNEATARKMLRLVGDRKLASETPTCSHWNYWTYPQWQNPVVYGGTTWTANTYDSSGTLSALAASALEGEPA